MEIQIRNKSTNEYRHAEKGNVKLSKILNYKRMTQIKLNENILIEDNVVLRGDLALIVIARDTILGENVIIHPSLNSYSQPYEYKNLNIGSFCYIGKNSIISSLKIGNYVYIGENCILSDRTKVGDNVNLGPFIYWDNHLELLEIGNNVIVSPQACFLLHIYLCILPFSHSVPFLQLSIIDRNL